MRKIIKGGICHILIAVMLLTTPVYAEDISEDVPSVTPGTEQEGSQEEVPEVPDDNEEPPVIECAAVTSLKTVPYSYTKIKLTWKKVADAEGYEIERSTTSGKKFKRLSEIKKGTTASYYDSKVTIGVTYYYRMRAYKKVGNTRIYSAYTKQVKQRAQVATAKITSAKKASYNSITIQWKKVSGASGYAVYRSNSKTGKNTRIATVKAGKPLKYTDKKRTCGKTYYYKVQAYRTYKKKNHYGSVSEAVAVKTTPNQVKYSGKMTFGTTTLTLKWKKASGADGYQIYYSTKSKSDYKLLKTIKNSKTLKWKKTKLNANKTYYFKIRAYKNVSGKKVYGAFSSVYKKETVASKLEQMQKKYKGTPYVYGGTTPKGWDCSGFTQWIMNNVYGVEISRGSWAQAQEGKAVNKNKMSTWKPGDLIFFSSGGRINHVGIYLGDGEMIHALNSKYDTIVQGVEYYDGWDRKNTLAKVRRVLE